MKQGGRIWVGRGGGPFAKTTPFLSVLGGGEASGLLIDKWIK